MAALRREMDEMIRKNQEEIENMNKSWEDKLVEQQKETVSMTIVMHSNFIDFFDKWMVVCLSTLLKTDILGYIL